MKRFEVMVHPQGEPIVVNAFDVNVCGEGNHSLVFTDADDKVVAAFNIWMACISEEAKSKIIS